MWNEVVKGDFIDKVEGFYMADVKICDRCGKRVETGMFPITLEPVRYVLGTETRVAVWGGMKKRT
jgi:hypothetical protein